MNDKSPLHAFFATLIAICYLATIAAVLAYGGKYVEALGFSAVITGLIGVIKIPSQRAVTVANDADNPVPTEDVK